MRWLLFGLGIAVLTAVGARFVAHAPMVVFVSSGLGLIFLSRVLGEATHTLSSYTGQRTAGLVNVSMTNLAEIIIIFAAVRANLIDLVQAGIVGSMMGNLLLVMGLSAVAGARRHQKLEFNPHTVTLFINQLFLVALTLTLPTIFANHIPQSRELPMSYLFSVMLVGAYGYFYVLSLRDQRFHEIHQQRRQLHHRWPLSTTLVLLFICGGGAFLLSELLVHEVGHIAGSVGCSTMFVGFIIMPMLGNLAENLVAVNAARKGMAELSLSIAVGSASQVGMIVAPCAVLFGALTGNAVTLHFANLPLAMMGLAVMGSFIVLRDNRWVINEGVMLLALYLAIVIAFAFTQ